MENVKLLLFLMRNCKGPFFSAFPIPVIPSKRKTNLKMKMLDEFFIVTFYFFIH